MIQFDARMLYDLLKSGYQDIFTSIYTDTNMQWDTEKISDKAKKLYKEHGEFTDDGYFITENQKICSAAKKKSILNRLANSSIIIPNGDTSTLNVAGISFSA